MPLQSGIIINALIIFQILMAEKTKSNFVQKRPDCVGIGCSETRKFQEDKINYKKLIIASGYDLNERPSIVENLPTHVKAAINVRNIMDVDERAQIVSLDVTLRLYWIDRRIKPKVDLYDGKDFFGQYVTLNPTIAEHIWMPDIFIDQAKTIRVPKYFIEPASVRIYSNSMIRYSSSVSLWQREIELDPDNDEYPAIQIKVKLRRTLGYHIVQTYIPSSLFVVIAWLSLFIPAESVPGRVGMVMTTMLTLTAMFASVRQNVPKISYCSVLDAWMLICIFFVFGTMLEFIVVTTFQRKKMKPIARKIEKFCIISYPVAFIMTNFSYWTLIHIIRALKHSDFDYY